MCFKTKSNIVFKTIISVVKLFFLSVRDTYDDDDDDDDDNDDIHE